MPSKGGPVGPEEPLSWCKNYCKVAQHPPPDAYFEWIYQCYTLSSAGYTIENNRLTMSEWKDLAFLKALLENREEDQRMSNLTAELVGFMAALQRRR